MTRSTHWRDRAQCVGKEDLFFDGSREQAAKNICRTCPVQTECLAFALRTHESYGVWGGKTPQERQRRANPRKPATRTRNTTSTSTHEPDKDNQ